MVGCSGSSFLSLTFLFVQKVCGHLQVVVLCFELFLFSVSSLQVAVVAAAATLYLAHALAHLVAFCVLAVLSIVVVSPLLSLCISSICVECPR